MSSKLAVAEALGLLGLTPCADNIAVESAWRRLCRDCHPDKRPDDPGARATFQALTAAKDVILKARPKISKTLETPRGIATPRDTRRIKILSPWGVALARLKLPQRASIYDAKSELESTLSIPTARQQLLCKLTQHELSNDELLANLPPPHIWMLVTSAYKLDMSEKLLEASRKGDAESVRQALDARADPCFCGQDGLTPIFMAAKQGDVEVARILCRVSADINAVTSSGDSPLMVASGSGFADFVSFLCSQRANFEQVAAQAPFHTPLTLAASNGRLDVIRMLWQIRADINRAAAHYGTPLYNAARNGHLEVVSFLCLVGADKDRPAADGETPSAVAAAQNYPEVVSHLCKVSTDLDRTALHQDTS